MKTLMLSLVLVLVLGGAALAAEGKPNSLTPMDAAAGQILLFDGETSYGWVSRGAAEWEVKDGAVASVPGSGTGAFVTTEFPNYRLTAEVRADAAASRGVGRCCASDQEIEPSHAYVVTLNDHDDRWPTGSIAGVATRKGHPKFVARWNKVEISAEGNHA